MDGADAAVGSTILIVFMDANGTKSLVPFNVGEDHDRFVRTEARMAVRLAAVGRALPTRRDHRSSMMGCGPEMAAEDNAGIIAEVLPTKDASAASGRERRCCLHHTGARS
jgi:hypothetical protein